VHTLQKAGEKVPGLERELGKELFIAPEVLLIQLTLEG